MNVVLIIIDTLRATRLGCYGYDKPTSPAIDAVARGGARAKRCFAPGIPTTPAHTTIFTGLHPITHNIVSHGGQVDLDRGVRVLPQLLQQGGYTTAAVDNLYDIKPWLARGYEYYINPSFRHAFRLMVSCEEINARAVPWIKAHASEPFFLFVHYWEPHAPYLPPERYRVFYPPDRDPFGAEHTTFEPIKRQPFWEMFGDSWFNKLGPVTDADYVASLYDAEIRHVDDGVAELVAALDDAGLADDTLVVITGDHGESLGSHDIFFDHHGLYDDVIHVPLIVRKPADIRCGAELDGMAQHLDIAPTILEAAGLPVPDALEGRSMWKALCGEAQWTGYPEVFCCECTWQAKWALRTETAKVIIARAPDHHGMPPRELYDLANDPAEANNVADDRPDQAHELEEQLEAFVTAALERTGRTADPLRAQGITLGKRWDSFRASGP